MILIYGAPMTGKSTFLSLVRDNVGCCTCDIDDVCRSIDPLYFDRSRAARKSSKVMDYAQHVLTGLKFSSIPGIMATHQHYSNYLLGFTFKKADALAVYEGFVVRYSEQKSISVEESRLALDSRGHTKDSVVSWYGASSDRLIQMNWGENISDYISLERSKTGILSLTFLKDESAYPSSIFIGKPYKPGKRFKTGKNSKMDKAQVATEAGDVISPSTTTKQTPVIAELKGSRVAFITHPLRMDLSDLRPDQFDSMIAGVDKISVERMMDLSDRLDLSKPGFAYFIHGVDGTGVASSRVDELVTLSDKGLSFPGIDKRRLGEKVIFNDSEWVVFEYSNPADLLKWMKSLASQ